MLQKTNHKYLFILLAAALLVISLINSMDIVSELFFNTGSVTNTGRNGMFKEFAIVNKALKTKIKMQHFTFDGAGASPFRTSDAAQKSEGSGRILNQEPGKKLFLKGTLLKEDALAIIVDEDGKTFICKQGDRIGNQVIANISDNMVTIKNGAHATVLKVQEP